MKGTITSKERSKIYISSDFANYNYANQDSKFYSNVVIKYDNKEIKCDNLDLIIDDGIINGIGSKIYLFENGSWKKLR